MSTEHQNSIKVKVFRAPTFLGGAQGQDVQTYLGDSKVSIGSYFEPQSMVVGSGLTVQEKEILLPVFVGVSSAHPDFMKKVETYYIDMDTKVPYQTGLLLEVGLKEDNNAPISLTNTPIVPLDYIKYRHLASHPYVGATKEDAEGTRKQFYIFNPEELQKKTKAKNDSKDAALAIFLQIKKEPTKVAMMLTLMGVNPKTFSGKNKQVEMEEALRKIVDSKPDEFNTIFSKKDIDTEYLIQSMLNHKIINKFGEKYMDPQADAKNQLLANSIEELIFFLKDKDNSGVVMSLRARLQEKETEKA